MQGPRYIVSKLPKASTKQGSKAIYVPGSECDCNVVWDFKGCCLSVARRSFEVCNSFPEHLKRIGPEEALL